MSCGRPHETECSEVLMRVYEYLDGELDTVAFEKIHQHLDECGPCLSEYDLDLVLKALVKRTCGNDCAPDDLRARILLALTKVRLSLG